MLSFRQESHFSFIYFQTLQLYLACSTSPTPSRCLTWSAVRPYDPFCPPKCHDILEVTCRLMSDPIKILARRKELTPEDTSQLCIVVEREGWRLDTMKYFDNRQIKVEKEPITSALIVRWSTSCSTLMQEEGNLSWCDSCAEGRMAHMKTFESYGKI